MNDLPAEFKGVMEPILADIGQLKLDDYWYEVKWDGVRLLTVIDKRKVEIINRHGRNKTIQFPELFILSQLLDCRQAVVDGEGVVIRNGRPDFRAVIKRNNRQSQPLPSLLDQLPISYMIFDLLAVDGESLLQYTYEERKSRLLEIIKPHPYIQSVDMVANGIDLWSAVQTMELEGIVAKRKGSPYQAGKKHHYWFKIKYRRREWCIIGGFTVKEPRVNALLLGIETDEGLQYCGRAGLVGDHARNPELLDQLKKPWPQSPFCNPQEVPTGSYYIKPYLQALIEFAEWTPDLKLRQPVIKEIRSVDSDPRKV